MPFYDWFIIAISRSEYKIVQNFELFPASGKTLAERLRVLAASCEELMRGLEIRLERTGNPPLYKSMKTFIFEVPTVRLMIPNTRLALLTTEFT
jgi:hypothetical protein